MVRDRVRCALVVMSCAAAVLAIGACNSKPSGQTNPQSSSSASQTAAAGTPTSKNTAAAPPPTITGEQLNGTAGALGTVFTPCEGDPKVPTVFDPASGQLVNAPAAPIPQGTELVGGGSPAFFCTLAGAPNDLKIFYLWNYRTPSEGLNPERLHLVAAVAGIHDKTVTQQAELPADMLGPSKIYPTTGGVVLSWCCRGKDALKTAAIDPNTLAVKWTSPLGLNQLDQSSVAFYDVFENKFTIRDVASGTDVVLDNVNTSLTDYEIDSGYILKQVGTGPDRYGYYSTVAHKFVPDIFVDDYPSSDQQVNEGKLLLWGKKTLKVIDVASAAVVFELSPEEVTAVDSYQFATSGDYLYIANRSDSPVIDMRTRQKVSSGWKVRPLDFLGPSWVLVDHRPNATMDCYKAFHVFMCGSNNAKDIVMQKVDNGVYPGPWY